MSKRLFAPVSKMVGGVHRTVHPISCKRCGESDEMKCRAFGGAYPPELVSRYFRGRGWDVSSRVGDDLCPACARHGRRVKGEIAKPALAEVIPITQEVADMAHQQNNPTPYPALVADPPREMSKEDKRIVYGKINEVYLDEVRGYDSGWTDERIAKDLGVPRAWVSTVRDEMFGAAEGNGEILRIRMEISELKAQAVALLEKADQLQQDLLALTGGKKRGAA